MPTAHTGSRLLPASSGAGPLLQRDYWAVVRNARLTPPELKQILSTRFPEFAPPELVMFHRTGASGTALEPGDTLAVDIVGSGRAEVRVIHADAQTLTLGTLVGHPEAGRITFGSYRNGRGDLVFHIRSRARAANRATYAAFLTAGDPMQTLSWIDFVQCVAWNVGEGIIGEVQVETREVEDEPDEEALRSPTYAARDG